MPLSRYLPLIVLGASLVLGGCGSKAAPSSSPITPSIAAYTADPATEEIALYWKDSHGQIFGNLGDVKSAVEKNGHHLLCAMNGGMYQENQSPLGLFIQNGKTVRPLNRRSGSGNFYMQPNGVFFLTTSKAAFIRATAQFKADKTVKYATQSGPMLVIDGKINPLFKVDSHNTNIRNGVGILPDGRVLLAMSQQEVNFYQFADFFRQRGCKNALYLDGFVSRMYCPQQHVMQTDGGFGVIIGVRQ